MTIAGIQPQIWISIVAILGVAGLSLLVDYLRGKNQQLREAMVELRLRRAQEQRQGSLTRPATAVQTSVAQPSPASSPKAVAKDEQKDMIAAAVQAAAARMAAESAAAANAQTPAKPSEPAKSFEEFISKPDVADRNNEARERNLAIREAQDRGVEFASPHGRRRTSNPAPENLPRLEDMNPREALAEWLNKRAAARTTPKPVTAPVPTPVVATPVVATPVVATPVLATMPASVPAPVPVVAQVSRPVSSEASATLAPVIETAPVAKPMQKVPAANGSAVVIDESLWESLLGRPAANKPVRIPDWTAMPATALASAPTTQVRFEVIQGAAGIPSGMHEQSTLNRLLDANKPFTGLVVSISVNQTDGSAVSHDVMLNVNHFVRGLLRDGDFACQTGADEFLILCPEEQAADAQRRISDISERLWDFQLRGVGSFSVMFGWGDVQVEGESLSEAVASATERMHQTRRARKTVSFESASPRRKVAAAI